MAKWMIIILRPTWACYDSKCFTSPCLTSALAHLLPSLTNSHGSGSINRGIDIKYPGSWWIRKGWSILCFFFKHAPGVATWVNPHAYKIYRRRKNVNVGTEQGHLLFKKTGILECNESFVSYGQGVGLRLIPMHFYVSPIVLQNAWHIVDGMKYLSGSVCVASRCQDAVQRLAHSQRSCVIYDLLWYIYIKL